MSQNANGNRNSTSASGSAGRASDASIKSVTSKSASNKNNEITTESIIQDESGVTYRVVQLPGDFFNAATTTASQTLVTQAVDISGLAGNNAQPMLINVGNLGSTSSLAVAGALPSSQMQLQTLEGQQYYIMIPSSDLLPTTASVPVGGSSGGVRTPQAARGKKGQAGAKTSAKPDTTASLISEAIEQAVGSANVSSSQSVPVVTAYIQESEDAPILPQKEIKRRVSHNEVEKRRRDKINNWIGKLARLVPAAHDESGKTAQSKGGVLAKTVDYIHELKSTTTDVQKFRNQIRDLTRENKVLKQKLVENGISLPVAAKTAMASSQSQASSGQGASQRNPTPVSIAPKGRLIPVSISSSGTVLLLSQDAATGAFSFNPSTPAPPPATDIEEEDMEMHLL